MGFQSKRFFAEQDNPVGTGYSFVENASDANLFVKTDEEAADDVTTLLMEIFNGDESLQKSPLYIVAESYGGKFAVTLALAALNAIGAGKLQLKLGGCTLQYFIQTRDSLPVFCFPFSNEDTRKIKQKKKKCLPLFHFPLIGFLLEDEEDDPFFPPR